jgi:hypothetical protein
LFQDPRRDFLLPLRLCGIPRESIPHLSQQLGDFVAPVIDALGVVRLGGRLQDIGCFGEPFLINGFTRACHLLVDPPLVERSPSFGRIRCALQFQQPLAFDRLGGYAFFLESSLAFGGFRGQSLLREHTLALGCLRGQAFLLDPSLAFGRLSGEPPLFCLAYRSIVFGRFGAEPRDRSVDERMRGTNPIEGVERLGAAPLSEASLLLLDGRDRGAFARLAARLDDRPQAQRFWKPRGRREGLGDDRRRPVQIICLQFLLSLLQPLTNAVHEYCRLRRIEHGKNAGISGVEHHRLLAGVDRFGGQTRIQRPSESRFSPRGVRDSRVGASSGRSVSTRVCGSKGSPLCRVERRRYARRSARIADNC